MLDSSIEGFADEVFNTIQTRVAPFVKVFLDKLAPQGKLGHGQFVQHAAKKSFILFQLGSQLPHLISRRIFNLAAE